MFPFLRSTFFPTFLTSIIQIAILLHRILQMYKQNVLFEIFRSRMNRIILSRNLIGRTTLHYRALYTTPRTISATNLQQKQPRFSYHSRRYNSTEESSDNVETTGRVKFKLWLRTNSQWRVHVFRHALILEVTRMAKCSSMRNAIAKYCLSKIYL